MFDTDGNQRVDKNEFLVVSNDFSKNKKLNTYHQIHIHIKLQFWIKNTELNTVLRVNLRFVATLNGINNIV